MLLSRPFVLALLTLTAPIAASSITVPAAYTADAFDRPDSCDVGNGWTSYGTRSCPLRLVGGRLVHADSEASNGCALTFTNRCAVLSRPMDLDLDLAGDALAFRAPVHARMTMGGGQSSLASGRLSHALTVLDDGRCGGFGVVVSRTDALWANSYLHFFDAGRIVHSFPSAVQFPDEVLLDLVIAPNGTAVARVLEGDRELARAVLDGHEIQATGGRLAVCAVEFADAGARAWVDDVQFSLV